MKKLLSPLLALFLMVLLLAAMPLTANAATSGYYTYEVSGGEVTITDVSESISGAITIPSTLGGYPVTGISSSAFENCTGLTSVTIPDGVTSIGYLAFFGCTSLTSVTIPDSVTNIGTYTFYDCTSLTSITIPDSVTSIGEAAFYNCTSLTSVTIPDSVTSICDYAFFNCSSLTSVTIPDSVTGIGSSVFSYCAGLTSVTIPDSVTTIEEYAFSRCSSLTSVIIPDSVTSIGDHAFTGCSSLTSITIPDSVASIEDSTFYNCTSLTSVTIPDSVTSIGEAAFYNCTSLTSVTIPDSVTSIGPLAFYKCSSLIGIWVSDKNTNYSNDKYGVLFNKCKTELIQAPHVISGDYTIPDSVTSIGDYAFYDCDSLTSVTIPDGVTSIGDYAFFNCSSLTGVYITDLAAWCGISFSNYDANPLYYTKKLYLNRKLVTDLVIPDGVTSIGSNAFYGCSSLTSVTIPDGVTSIRYQSFYGCSSLASVTIPDSVTNIGSSAFHSCSSLTSVTIPDSVTSIGSNAFYGCSSLTSVTIPYSVTSIGSSAFYGCSNLTSVTIPDSVTSIGAEAFRSCTSLTSVTIPYSVTSIRSSAFYGCSSLASVTIGDSVTSIGKYAFSDCTSLTSVTIGDSVTSIGDFAFRGCTSLTSVTYCGTEKQWNAISIGSSNTPLTNAERIRHNYVDQSVITMPSFTAPGEQQKVCSVCGDTVTETLDMLVGEVSGWNVTLCDDLQVNFHLNISESIENTARVRIVVGEEGYTFRVSGLEKNEDGLYIASVNIAAAQMTDYIFVTVINGGDLAETASYTVRGYADTILADEGYSQYHQLVREMLNYGAAAQVYFDYEEENLANEGITDTGSVEIPDSVDNELSVSGSAEGVTFYGASLIFQNKIAVRYYFRFIGDINDCCFTVNDTSYAPQLKDGLYYVEIADILPQDLDEEITLTVTDANGDSLAVCYNPMNYIVRMNEKGSAELQALVKALYNYHLAAKALA